MCEYAGSLIICLYISHVHAPHILSSKREVKNERVSQQWHREFLCPKLLFTARWIEHYRSARIPIDIAHISSIFQWPNWRETVDRDPDWVTLIRHVNPTGTETSFSYPGSGELPYECVEFV